MKIFSILFLFCVSLMTGCHPAPKDPHVLKVGTIEGPETQLMEVAAKVAKQKFNLEVQIVIFSDYNMPNVALNDGSIDANMFQHQPFLNAAVKAHQFNLVAIGKTFIYPMGVYSKKIKNLAQIKPKAVVAIPNDPSNEARALLLLEQAKLIQLKNYSFKVTPLDIANNPQQLQFKELDAAQLPRALDDVDLAVINTNYAIPAGLLPTRDALFLENKNSPYANILVVKTTDKNDPRFQQLIEALHAKEVVLKADALFQKQAIQAW